jgi:hypothetical protein
MAVVLPQGNSVSDLTAFGDSTEFETGLSGSVTTVAGDYYVKS